MGTNEVNHTANHDSHCGGPQVYHGNGPSGPCDKGVRRGGVQINLSFVIGWLGVSRSKDFESREVFIKSK